MKKLLLFATALLLMSFLMIRCSKDGPESVKTDPPDKEYLGLTDEIAGGFSGGGSTNGVSDSTYQDSIPAGQITAAEWNDLDNWDFWLNLGQNEEFNLAKDNWNFYPHNRYSVLVRDQNNDPLVDCTVSLRNKNSDVIWKSRTDNQGKAELWLGLNGQNEENPSVAISYDDQQIVVVDPVQIEQGVNEVTLYAEGKVERNVDILFVVDATGSMSDEIEYLKSELMDVTRRVKEDNSLLDLRLGAVFYRDEGDEFITRVSPFYSSLAATIQFIGEQHADGGGDYEEAVHTALNTAVTQLSWSEHARARLLFLVLDAPAHQTDAIVSDLNAIVKQAAEKGIKIIPVSASGVNKNAEFLFRFFAIATNGSYIFITNNSGIGGEHIEATVGEYQVELLNDLLVKVINKYTK
jgi:hypothetical protein